MASLREQDLRPDLTPEHRRTAYEFVFETLRRAILRGDLGGGTRLIQSDIASRLGVSTTPVREALRNLASSDLITLDRNRGGVVRELDWEEVRHVLLIRERLEPLVVELSAASISQEELARAELLHVRMVEEENLTTWVEMNSAFHAIYHSATRIPRLADLMNGFEESAARYLTQSRLWRPDLRRRANEDHRMLIDATGAGDVERALEVMAGHSAMSVAAIGDDRPGVDAVDLSANPNHPV